MRGALRDAESFGVPRFAFGVRGARARPGAVRFAHKVDDFVCEALFRAPSACKVDNSVHEGPRGRFTYGGACMPTTVHPH